MRCRIIRTVVFICMAKALMIAQPADQIVIGHKHVIESDILSEDREYWVSVPNSYDDVHLHYKKYPVLILLDGNIHFHSVSGMVNSMSSGSSDKMEIPEMIVIGVLNVNRERDFTPDKIVTKRENQTGGGDNFMAFLKTELIPKIENEYRTLPYRVLIGHSLAGLITTHSYLQDNSPFNSFVSIDPSFGTWDQAVIKQKTSSLDEYIYKRPLYLATANWGKRNLRNRDRHIQFIETLRSQSKDILNAKQKYYSNKNHSSIPFPAIYDGLSYIFEGYNQSYRAITDVNELVHHYQELSNRISFIFHPPEELVNRIGYKFLNSSQEIEKQIALRFFQLNTENYPDSYNVFDSLGEAHYQIGNDQKALENFRKSIALNPDNRGAKEMIAKIKHRLTKMDKK